MNYSKLLTVVAIIGVMSLIGHAEIKHDEQAKLKDVYTICQAQRTGTWQVPMLTCGQAEANNHAEYLCKANNTSLSNQCWVEAK